MKLFWDKHSSQLNFNINTFRNTKKNNVFANWSPYTRGLLYQNFFINYYVNKNKNNFIKFKKTLSNLNFGNPPCILYNNKYNITYDDCLSFEENSFLSKYFKNKKINIVEIGPGYGRSVEFIINNYEIKRYFVIDYEKILFLTKKYLKKVLSSKNFDKIIFFNFEDFNFEKNIFFKKYRISEFDLFFNSDSFHEIEQKIIKKYLNYFSHISKNFFIKNAVAKYRTQDLVNHLNKNTIPKFNTKLGLNSEIINIFDDKSFKIQSKRYLKRYNPYSNSSKVFSKISEVYPSTLLALYKK